MKNGVLKSRVQRSEGSLNGGGMVECVAGCGLTYQATAISAPFSYAWNDNVFYMEICMYKFLLSHMYRFFLQALYNEALFPIGINVK